jgi:hypothetical protein
MNEPAPEPLATTCAWCGRRKCPGCGAWLKPLPFVRDAAPVRCPDCGADLGENRPGNVTHGVCEPCALRLLAEPR